MNMQSKLCTQALHAPEVSGVGAGRPVRPAGGRSGVVLVSPPSGRAGPLQRLEPGGAAAEPSSNCLQHALSDSAWVKVPHLASHILGRMAARISADWEARYAHPIYLPETFVDPQRFRGTCYLAANWKVGGDHRTWQRRSNSPAEPFPQDLANFMAPRAVSRRTRADLEVCPTNIAGSPKLEKVCGITLNVCHFSESIAAHRPLNRYN
jgi:hypothetical protein